MIEHLMFLSVPGLRPVDVHDANLTPTLYQLARDGAHCPLTPTFPCVTSPVQASMLTGVGPGVHGVIANGFYWPHHQAVEFWTGRHKVIEHRTFFTHLAQEHPELTSAVWHAQNIKDADANYIITPSPIHESDGTTRPWCYAKPDGLYEEMLAELGHFPLHHYWGPLSNIESTRWILEGALWLAANEAANFQYVYLPHLDFAAQRFGPDSHEAAEALAELDAVLADFFDRYNRLPFADRTAWVLAGEYAMTAVSDAICPNRMLRQAGLLEVREEGGHEVLDIGASDAFAMVDHQFAHVFVARGETEAVADLFRQDDRIADVIEGRERAAIGMDHPRCAPVILVSRSDQWFSYYWWLDDAAAPAFARQVDIHSKPGYDPLELFMDKYTRQIPLDVKLIKGSHGAPATASNQKSLLLTTHPDLLEHLPSPVRDVDVYGVLCRAFAMESGSEA